MSLKKKIRDFFIKLGSKLSGGIDQDTSDAIISGKIADGIEPLLRQAQAEGIVMLKNDGTLPLKKSTVSVFGRNQINYFFSGYGSGGDVKKPYVVNLVDGIRNCEDLRLNEELAKLYKDWTDKDEIDHGYWGHWPYSYNDMPISEDIVKKASEESDAAIVVIGRSSGEDRENVLEKGSYYIKDEEFELLNKVTNYFNKVVVLLNVGSIMDFSWIEKYKDKINSVLIVWQGGMESGNGIADVLSGKVSPSGKLTDTIAVEYKDYPSSENFGNADFNNYEEDIYVGYRYFETFNKDKVLYPFGFGLTYSKFSVDLKEAKDKEDYFDFDIEVKNIGDDKGKEVVQIYIQKPNGKLGNPYRQLVDYKKTKELDLNESQSLKFSISKEVLASYDDSNVTGNKSSYVIEKGTYVFSIGSDVRQAKDVFSIQIKEDIVTKKCEEAMAPQEDFNIFKNDNGKVEKIPVTKRTVSLKERILSELPQEIPMTQDKGYKLKDVKDGNVSMDDFISQLSLDEMEAISRGDYTMNNKLGPAGNAGVLGGVLQSLRDKGIPPLTTTDGPSGIRLFTGCSLIPIGALLASTFNTQLVEDIYAKLSEEMVDKGSDILLSPGMNIHRSVLCGRNFEYYSEDPLLTGTMGAAAVRGTQKMGVSACPKHFCCNNQEFKRTTNDSRVSERALREIYLKPFEICIKQAKPLNIMTSYNRVNGVWSHYNYELCHTILRKEWGYEGSVMTDWWMQYKPSPEFPNIQDNGYRVRSRVNILMPGGKRLGRKKPDGTLLKTLGKPDGITLGEIQRNTKDILNYIINTNKF